MHVEMSRVHGIKYATDYRVIIVVMAKWSFSSQIYEKVNYLESIRLYLFNTILLLSTLPHSLWCHIVGVVNIQKTSLSKISWKIEI